VIKVCGTSAFYSSRPQLFSEKAQKTLDNPLTGVYTVYVESGKGKKVAAKLDVKLIEASWSKYIATVEKKIVKKKIRLALKIDLKELVEAVV